MAMAIRKTLVALFVALAVFGAANAYALPFTAFSLSSDIGFRNASWAFGEIFTVGADDLSVTALGAYDNGGNGFVTPSGIPVGIFRESDDVLLASTNVTNADPLILQYRFATISPLTLLAGMQYRVVAVNEQDLYNVAISTFSVNPAITRNGFAYGQSTTLKSLGDVLGPPPDILWMANFRFEEQVQSILQAVPEPASMMLLGLGLAALIARRRARRS
jgi:hypothetical protein